MPDLKAAAERLRSQVSEYRDSNYLNSDQNADNRARHESLMESVVLAAQALEAWAWQQEKGADVQYDIEDDSFVCDTFNGQYRRCTPLGAVMAAMEGEKNG